MSKHDTMASVLIGVVMGPICGLILGASWPLIIALAPIGGLFGYMLGLRAQFFRDNPWLEQREADESHAMGTARRTDWIRANAKTLAVLAGVLIGIVAMLIYYSL